MTWNKYLIYSPADDDIEFDAMNENDVDDELTLDEQEKNEHGQTDHKEEIENLEKEGNAEIMYLLITCICYLAYCSIRYLVGIVPCFHWQPLSNVSCHS